MAVPRLIRRGQSRWWWNRVSTHTPAQGATWWRLDGDFQRPVGSHNNFDAGQASLHGRALHCNPAQAEVWW